MTRVLVATRSSHKLGEIQQILSGEPTIELLNLTQAGIEPDPSEEQIEAYDTFAENALAKAHHFARLSGFPTLADDSGLCVDALEGAPGVRSKRFSGRTDLSGMELDRANNERLLKGLDSVAEERRTAHYICAVALVSGVGEHVFHGRCDGLILREPRGTSGFGYDPLFLIPELNATFGELPTEVKNRISHRARALRAALPDLRRTAAAPGPGSPADALPAG